MSTESTGAPRAKYFLTCFPVRPIALEPGRAYSIGRAEGNNIVLADADVSRHHAVIAWDDDAFIMRDLDSHNGSYVNRQEVQRSTLQSDDRIKFGNRSFVFLKLAEDDARRLYRKQQNEGEDEVTEALDIQIFAQDQSFAGAIFDFGLPELIQTLEMNTKTGVLTVVGDYGRGSITVRQGEVVSAQVGSERGEEAVYQLLAVTSGYFEFENLPAMEDEAEIKLATSALLMEGFRRQDEKMRLSEGEQKQD